MDFTTLPPVEIFYAYTDAPGYVIDAAVEHGVKGIVLDVRGDPGGLLDAAVGVSSLWLSNKTVLTERRDGKVSLLSKAHRDRLGRLDILPGGWVRSEKLDDRWRGRRLWTAGHRGLEKREELISGTSRKAVDGVSYDVGVLVFRQLEADGESLRRGNRRVVLGSGRDARAN